MDATEMRRQILNLLDRWDEEHETSGCPAKPGECIHSASAGLRVAIQYLETHRLVGVAKALGIDTRRTRP